MPTDKERREKARSLRGLCGRDYGEAGVPIDDIERALGVESVLPGSYDPDDVDTLAGLIDPGPERTCRMTKIGGDRVLAGWWECSECGPVYPPCKDEIARWALQRCPRCGAKVVDE